MNHELSIARRLFGQRNEGRRVSRPAIVIATLGVAVGLAVMIISVCVVLGFKQEIRNKVMGLGGHIEVINYQSQYSAESQPIVVDDVLMLQLRRLPGVAHVQRFCMKAGMLKTDDAFQGVMLRGVAEEYDTAFLSRHLVEGALPRFSGTKSSNKIVISRMLARQLHLNVGDRVYAYFFSESVRARHFVIAGIYETHLSEFDKSWVFTDLYTCNRLNGWESDQVSGAEVWVEDYSGTPPLSALFAPSATSDRLDMVAAQVANRVNRQTDHYDNTYTSPTIRELYPSIFAWLSLLDTNVWVILFLMVGISLFTMTSGLLIIILERTNFIAVMKSLGSTNRSLRKIFLYFATMLIGRGLLLGNLLGIGLCLLQQQLHLVHLDAATYYVDSVPILFSWPLILLINVATFIISVLVLIIPTFLISKVEPARVMRFE